MDLRAGTQAIDAAEVINATKGTRRNTNTRGNTEEDAAKGAQRNTNTRGDSKEDTTKGARRNTTATAY